MHGTAWQNFGNPKHGRCILSDMSGLTLHNDDENASAGSNNAVMMAAGKSNVGWSSKSCIGLV